MDLQVRSAALQRHKPHEGIFDRVFDKLNVFIVLLVCVLIIYPFLNILAVSLSDSSEIIKNVITIFPRKINLLAYEKILVEMSIIRNGLKNSILYTASGTALSLVLTASCAYGLSRKSIVGKRLFLAIVSIPLFFEGGIVPLYILVDKLEMIDTIFAVILPYAILSYNLIIMRSFFQKLPDEIIESSAIEGATAIDTFLKVALPMSGNVLLTIGLFYALYYWNSFQFPLFFLYDRDMFPLSIILKELLVTSNSISHDNISRAENAVHMRAIQSATIIISVIPIMVFYPFIQKLFARGIMVGALKG